MSIDKITLVRNQEEKTMESSLLIRIGVYGVSEQYINSLASQEPTLYGLSGQGKPIKLEFSPKTIHSEDPEERNDKLKEDCCHFFFYIYNRGDHFEIGLSRIKLTGSDNNQTLEHCDALCWYPNRKRSTAQIARNVARLIRHKMSWEEFKKWIDSMDPGRYTWD